MKLKLKNPQPAPDGAPPEAPANGASQPAPATPATTAAPKLNLKFKQANPPSAEAADAPKQKRKYTKKPKVDENGQPGAKPGHKPKKRALEDGEEGAPAKRKPKPTMKSLAMVQESDDEDDALPEPIIQSGPSRSRPQPVRTQSVKLSFKPKGASAPQRSSTAILKVKGQGKPPTRPPGVGYDSEAEEAEVDPAIESQFVLRMVPGSDCDLLRRSIEEKTIGKSQSHGGPGVYFRFFDREGRKAMVTIQGRSYAASMVELPCVIESLKSWNKKDWVKTADVCQMLLVLGRVNSEEEAKKASRPREVEPDSHRYPHGLTPPMHWVRKRRFRPRKSYLDVERIETQTEALLQADDDADESRFDFVDSDAEYSEVPSADEDAQGEDEDMVDAQEYVLETPIAGGVDESELLDMFHNEFDTEEHQIQINGHTDGHVNEESATIQVETPATIPAHEVAMHAIHQGNVVIEPESAASTPAAITSPDNDDDDDDDGDDDEEADPEAKAKQDLVEQVRAEVRELDQAIELQQANLAGVTNKLYKKRLQSRIDQMIQDKKVKLSKIGEDED